MDANNRLIVRNTIIIYARMIIVTIVGLYSSRFVLQALGVSDYGLYNVVGGLIAMLNFVSAAMSTTTRRFINIEMGKQCGDLNKVFNISLLLHAGFAVFILLVAETIGIWYINNLLNVEVGKESDAMFVFQISTIVACLGIINVPYQSLIEANEHFFQSAIIDILVTFIKLGVVIYLVYYNGNALRFYAIIICIVTALSFILYYAYCSRKWKNVIKLSYHKDRDLYKEILFFNNYTALGAAASIGKSQGSTLLVNFFFGTIINGAFAIAYQVESYVYMFVNKLTLASNPQVAKNISSGNVERAIMLAEKNSRYSILIMTIFFFALTPQIHYVLVLWLKDVPAEADFLCVLTMIDALVKSFTEGTNGYIQASGKIKWFQYLSVVTSLINIPLGYIAFKLGMPAYFIIISFIITSIFYRIISLYLMRRLLHFGVYSFVNKAYIRPIVVILLMTLFSILNIWCGSDTHIPPIVLIVIYTILSTILSVFIGLNKSERCTIISNLKHHIL